MEIDCMESEINTFWKNAWWKELDSPSKCFWTPHNVATPKHVQKKPSTLDDASHRLLECSVNCVEHLQGGILQAVIENRAVLGVLGYIFCNTTLCKLEVGAEGRKESRGLGNPVKGTTRPQWRSQRSLHTDFQSFVKKSLSGILKASGWVHFNLNGPGFNQTESCCCDAN